MIRDVESARAACVKYWIPEHMHDAVEQYVVHRRECGSFFMALMENNFLEAASRADHINLAHFPEWARLIYNEFPNRCHGSRENVKAWLGKADEEETDAQ